MYLLHILRNKCVCNKITENKIYVTYLTFSHLKASKIINIVFKRSHLFI